MSAAVAPEFWIFVGVTGGIFAVLALGLQLEFGYGGLLNFGHVAFMAIGAYAMAILVVQADMSLWIASGLALLLTIPFSVLLGVPTLRLRADYFAMTTLAFAEIVRFVAVNEQWLTGGPQGTINLAGAGEAASYNAEWLAFQHGARDVLVGVFGEAVSLELTMMVIVWTVFAILACLVAYLVRSPWGRTVRSIREDEEVAAALGKRVFLIKQQVLALGSVIGAVAGLLHAYQFSFFSPADFVPLVTFFAWLVIIVGGVGTTWGVPLGALAFAVLFAATRFLTFPPFGWFDSAERAYVRMIAIGLTLILLILYRPQGVAGKREELVLE